MSGKVQRPTSAKVVATRADKYLSRCKSQGRYPSVTGLALEMGYDTRQELEKEAKKGTRIAQTLRRACSLIEEEIIQAAYEKTTYTGAKFFLQSGFGYDERPQPEPPEDTIVVEVEE